MIARGNSTRGAAWAATLLALLSVAAVLFWQPAEASEIRIPEASRQYRMAVERAAAEYHGLHASPARLAAQIHAESTWRPDARSPFAHGMLQFVPATAAWLPEVCPELGKFDPWDPWQSIRAGACYDRWCFERVRGADRCEREAFAKSCYNGGLSWVSRDKRLAEANDADPLRWFGHVEHWTARAEWARKENRDYVRRILLTLEQAYIAAGWPGEAVCR